MSARRTSPADLAVDGLAVFRITRLLQVDSVPPMPKLRQAALDKLARTPYGDLVDCPWCLSVWVGALVAIARHASPRLWAVLAFVLASSAVTGVITQWVDSLEPEERIEMADPPGDYPRWAGTEPQEL